jgi:hypothetical protein
VSGGRLGEGKESGVCEKEQATPRSDSFGVGRMGGMVSVFLKVHESARDLDQPLVQRSGLVGATQPEVFEHIMSLIEPAVVEAPEIRLQLPWLHGVRLERKCVKPGFKTFVFFHSRQGSISLLSGLLDLQRGGELNSIKTRASR